MVATVVPSASVTTASRVKSDLPRSAGFGFDSCDLLVVEAGFGTHVGFGHRDELDVEVFDQWEILGGVERDQRNDPAEDFGDGEQHAGVDDAEVVPIALSRDGGGGKTGPGLDDLHAHLAGNRDRRTQGAVHHVHELVGVGSHSR